MEKALVQTDAAADQEEPGGIAVIGMAGRFPGAKNVEEFWENLRIGRECISFFTDEQLAAAGVPPEMINSPNYVKANGVLDGVELFDPGFFGFSPREAEIIDPQHKVFLECAWEALENAGYNSETYQGAIGIYGGMHMSKYLINNLLPNRDILESAGALQLRIWNDKDFLCPVVAYKLNLRGPAITVQTACSTSLVAVSLAAQSLLNYLCDIALAGGVSISVPQSEGGFAQDGVLSPDGHCRAFDARAAGTANGNGAGLIVLKRLNEALADGDQIYAVIKGSAVNNDGSMKVGFTAPSVNGQVEVVGMAQALAAVEPETITYIEAHGTGTPLGDPIEIAALTEVFQIGTDKKNFCAIGSVKTNIGHLDAAAGVAGFIKTVQALQNRQIPPSLNFERPNPAIDFAGSPFYVNARLSDWPANGFPRRAGISSFSMGGVNAHVVLEEAPEREPSSASRPEHLLVLSAKTASALETATRNLLDHMKRNPAQAPADVAYTLQVGRRGFDFRRAIVCESRDDAMTALETMDPARVLTSAQEPTTRPVIFLFPGQGAQYVNMAAGLYDHEPTFREHFEICADLARSISGIDLRSLLYPDEAGPSDADGRLALTLHAQPALFAVEYALARLWMEWGAHPRLMIGHSIGEYVAACLAGVFSLEDALAIVVERARLMQQLPRGAMLAISKPEDQLRAYLNGGLSLAAVNGPSLCVVSGSTTAVRTLETRLLKEGVEYRPLHTSHAFHSEMVEPILESFAEKIGSIKLRAPGIPYISNVTGKVITTAEATEPAYWTRHLRQTVRFTDGLDEALRNNKSAILIEAGPGRTLGALVNQHPLKTSNHLVLASLRHPHDRRPDVGFLLANLGKLWLCGAEVDWPAFYKSERRHRVALPTYPFERRRCWIDPPRISKSGRPERLAMARDEEATAAADSHEYPAPAGIQETHERAPSLPGQKRPHLWVDYVAPVSEVEKELTEIWQRFLGFEQIGVNDDFFELGGHSLLATQLISRIRDRFQVSPPLTSFFATPTIAGLAKEIETARQKGASEHADRITTVSRDRELPLSFAQQRIWFLDQWEPENAAYNIQDVLRLRGSLNIQTLEMSLNEIVRRHEILRTTYRISNGQPVQVIAQEFRLAVPVIDLSGLSGLPRAVRDAEVGRLLLDEANRSFNLTTDPLMRVNLLKIAEQEYLLASTLHHIAADGWSITVLYRELDIAYTAFLHGNPSPLLDLPFQYADFAYWQRQWMQGEAFQARLAYWKEQLAGLPAPVELPTDRPRPARQTYNGALKRMEIRGDTFKALQDLTRRESATIYMAVLAVYQALLYRYSGQEDIAVGLPIANRNRSDLENLIGFFANTLVARTRLSGRMSFKELLGHVRDVSLDAYERQDTPFERLVEALKPERDTSGPVLFRSMLALQKEQPARASWSGVEVQSLPAQKAAAMFDMTIYFVERENEVSATIEYNTDLFDEPSIERIAGHFKQLLQSSVSNPEAPIWQSTLLTPAEEQELLVNLNQTERAYPRWQLVHELFEAQAARTPDSIAAGFEDQQLSYSELNLRANQLARCLRRMGAGCAAPVGMMVERSLDILTALLGILKAGGAYIPIDPDHPTDRIASILEDAQPLLVLTEERLLPNLPQNTARALCQALCIDTEWAVIERESTGNLSHVAGPDNLAYVIFTSGSTGRPKGVQISHRAVVNFLMSMANEPGLEESDVLVAVTTLSFDIAGLELFLPLITGARTVIASREESSDGELLARRITRSNATVMQATPATWRMLLAANWEGKRGLKILCGGEALPTSLANSLAERCGCLWNLYGPTETTIWSAARRIESEARSVPIGQPIANTRFYVVDNHMRTVPVNIPGELLIGGAGLARGYSRQPDHTAERFVPDPFGSAHGARLYRTSDLVRHLPGGEVEYVGRIDHQVKIRGFRIELGEIEQALIGHPAVREAVVVSKEDVTGEKSLAGYVTIREGESGSFDLRSYLRGKLPEYMAPAVIVILDEMPLTPNRKIDRSRLPAPEPKRVEAQEERPKTVLEEVIGRIWSELLRVTEIGINENFFDLGGHSLLATQVMSRIRDVLEVELSARDIFSAPTIAELAEQVKTAIRTGQRFLPLPLLPMPRDGNIPLSFAQQRMWVLDQLEPDTPAYNLAGAVRLSGKLNIRAIEQTIDELIRRHESLRTTFQMVRSQPVQIIEPARPSVLPLHGLDRLTREERETEVRRLASAHGREPFDLVNGPLVRARLLRIEENEHVLLMAMHHIVFDGWSMGVLVREMAALYETFAKGNPSPLPELPIQYADYAVWQRKWLDGEVLESQLAYWRRRLSGEIQALDLPTDKPRPATQRFEGASIRFTLSRDLTDKLKSLGRSENATLFMLLLSAFSTLLHRYSGQDDITVGSPIAGRGRVETESLIGLFVNTLVLRSDLSGDPSFRQFLGRIKEVCLEASAHQDVPFERLVEEIQPDRDLGRAPLFQAMFALQNHDVETFRLADLTFDFLETDIRVSKFEMTLFMYEVDHQLTGSLEYNTGLFERTTIERMIGHFKNVLEAVSSNPDLAVLQIPLLEGAERRRLIVEFNDTQMEVPQDRGFIEMFEEQAEDHPNTVAVVCEGSQLTYGRLNEAANRMAYSLAASGVGPDVIVAVLAERGIDFLIAMIAIFKAGGVYLPLDPRHPAGRIANVLEQSDSQAVLTTPGHCPVIDQALGSIDGAQRRTRPRVLEIGDLLPADRGAGNPDKRCAPRNLAYVIFTSGSTGSPKGAMVERLGMFNHLSSKIRDLEITSGDVVAQTASQSFDISVWQFLVALCVGARVHIFSDQVASDPAQLIEEAGRGGVTVLETVPSMLRAMLDHLAGNKNSRVNLASLRWVIPTGEALAPELCNRWFNNYANIPLMNAYGPTECSDDVSHHRIYKPFPEAAARVPIGYPLANIRLYILDKLMEPAPIGVPGELWVGGTGVGRGYLNGQTRTAEVFRPDPFAVQRGGRLYKTGDRARLLSDGRIEFLGRVDYQVKIRGFRIELGEIESVLIEHPSIDEVVVLDREISPGDTRLAAFVVCRNGAAPSQLEMRSFLQGKLPDYMLPSAFVILDAIPLTPNGKIDRRSLAGIGWIESEAGAEFVPARNPIEVELGEIWFQVLKRERIGIHDNFFELGGHSLLATQVISRIRDQLGVELPLRALFESPTIAGLALSVVWKQTEGVDVEEVARILEELENLSEDNAQAMVSQP